jgi:phosphoribosylglycinamide formyltransferase 1
MMRLGIIGSTRGTNMLKLIDAINEHRLDASIEVVISNKIDAMILERARSFGIPALFASTQGLRRSDYDKQLTTILRRFRVDLVVLIGYMRILSEEFVQVWQQKIINVHPSLLPSHAGLMDLQVHEAVIAGGDRESGCTVHYVTEHVDAGPILVQKRCSVVREDSAESLKAKVQGLEGDALIDAIELIIKNNR